MARAIEYILCCTGGILLGCYGAARGVGELEAAAGVAYVDRARSAELPAAARESPPSLWKGATPDLSRWAAGRISAFREALSMPSSPPVALVRIPRLGLEVPLYDGADEHNLNRGVARIAGTAALGGAGNLGIAGHRDGWFRVLEDIEVGDRIEVETLAERLAYSVSYLEVVEPREVQVLAPTPRPSLTLVTCHTF